MIKKLKDLKHRAIVRLLAIITGAALVIAALSGCGASDDDCKGDPGKVTEKDYDPSYTTGSKASKVTHPADYDVTVLRDNPAEGEDPTYEKDVSSTAYDWVNVGSRWPSAKHCQDGKVKD